MNTQQQIDQQLNDDYSKFYEKIYDGKWPVPDRVIEFFKAGIKSLPPFYHKINFNKVKSISTKKISELTYGDIHEVVKVILNSPLEKIMPEIAESEKAYLKGIEYYIKVERFILEYNALIDEFQQKLKKRKVALEHLSNPNLKNGSLSIIN